MEEPRLNKALTWEEIMAGLSRLAEEGEGAQRTGAYRLLMSAHSESSGVTLPEPLTQKEFIQRLARLMKSRGKYEAKQAYHVAWPRTKVDRVDILPKPPEEEEWKDFKFPTTLKQLRLRFGGYPKYGNPKGYPVNSSVEAKRAWLMAETKRIIKEHRAKQREAEKAMEASGATPGTGPEGAVGSPG